MQRVRIGVTGLAAVFLLVLLAAAVIGTLHRGSTQPTHAVADAGSRAATEPPKEPLAELGVAPGNAQPSGAEGNAAAPAAPLASAPPATNPSVAGSSAPAARAR